jgi:hypothetical protein
MSAAQFNSARGVGGTKVFIRASVTENSITYVDTKEVNLEQIIFNSNIRTYGFIDLNASRTSFSSIQNQYVPNESINFEIKRNLGVSNSLEASWYVKKNSDTNWTPYYNTSNLTVDTNLGSNPGLNKSSMSGIQFDSLRENQNLVQVKAEILDPRTNYDLNADFISPGSQNYEGSSNLIIWNSFSSGDKPAYKSILNSSHLTQNDYKKTQTISQNITINGQSYPSYKFENGNGVILKSQKLLFKVSDSIDRPFSIVFWLRAVNTIREFVDNVRGK